MRLPEPAAARPDLAALFAVMPVAVLVIDPQDQIAHANALAEEMLNQSERLLVGQPSAAILPPRLTERVGNANDVALYDTEIANARGVKARVDLVEAALPDHPGWRVVTLHATSHRLERSGERSGGARAVVGAAAMLAHEIRNPLSGIRGAAQLLGRCELTTLITTEVDRIAALIDRMQEFGDTRPLSVGAANIYPILGHARGVALAGFARGVRIEDRFDPSLPHALVNPDALTQIVINLLKNACEAVGSRERPWIGVTTAYRPGIAVSRANGERVALPIEICVVDNGPGAPADIAAHLFDPFVSGRSAGQGLGLSLVDKLVRDMGGIVQYAREGDPERTVFRVLLPRASA